MVLGKLPVPGCPDGSDSGKGLLRLRSVRFVWMLLLPSAISLLSPSLRDGPIEIKILSPRAVRPTATNQMLPL